jgi:selenocysteine lyase/cysteine desulfurase
MNRRTAMAALFAMPAVGNSKLPPLPAPTLHDRDPERYWELIRKEQFLLPKWRAFLNNGSLGVAPKVVVQAVTAYLERAAAMDLPDGEYPRWGYETLDAQREEMAAALGCDKDGLAFTHNATEAISTIAAGLELKPGDEVLMTDQEHGSGKSGWLMRQARDRISVREVALPLPPRNPEEITDRLISAITPQTKVLFFSAITTTTGLVLPARQICDAARAKGIITVVDGAHMNGQIAARIADLGCDFYAGSPHKWMFAPAGCGFLWGRKEMLDRLWPAIVTGGWDNREFAAARFMRVGTNNRAIFEGMLAGVRFAREIGPERIYARAHSLARMVRQKAAETRGLELLTPDDDRMYGSLVTFVINGFDHDRFVALAKQRRIWMLPNRRLRVSTHIHTRPSDIDLLFETLNAARS